MKTAISLMVRNMLCQISLLLILLVYINNVTHAQSVYCGKLLSTDVSKKTLSPYIEGRVDDKVVWRENDTQGLFGWATCLDCNDETNGCVSGGYFSGEINWFGIQMKGIVNRFNGFVISYDRKGNYKWHKALATVRKSSVTSVLATADGGAYVSAFARGHKGDLVELGIPTNYYSALLLKLDAQGEIEWTTDVVGVFGGKVALDSKGKLYWATARKHQEVSNAYQSQIHQVDPKTGQIQNSITNEGLFLHDARPHSQMSFQIDYQDNLILSQINAKATTDPLTEETTWQKQLVVTKYDPSTHLKIYQEVLVSQEGLTNTFSKSMLFLRDTKALPDGSVHLAIVYNKGELTFYPADTLAPYTEAYNTTANRPRRKTDTNECVRKRKC